MALIPDIVDTDPASNKLYVVNKLWNGGDACDTVSLVWSSTPEPANAVAVRCWGSYDEDEMDSAENIDGAATKRSECYTGSSRLDTGTVLLVIAVSAVTLDTVYGLGTRTCKRVLASRGVSKKLPEGCRGAEATEVLRERLAAFLGLQDEGDVAA